MATKKTTAPAAKEEPAEIETVKETAEVDPTIYLRQKVPFRAFKDHDKYKDDIIVGVNGRIYRIKRGEDVMIPRFVYNVIKRGEIQDIKTAELMENEANSFANAVREFEK